jgi:hypothetical protein
LFEVIINDSLDGRFGAVNQAIVIMRYETIDRVTKHGDQLDFGESRVDPFVDSNIDTGLIQKIISGGLEGYQVLLSFFFLRNPEI